MDRWATFDCYGTLVDWNGGIRTELERLFGVERAEELVVRYHELEPEIQDLEPGMLVSRGAHDRARDGSRQRQAARSRKARRAPSHARCLPGRSSTT
jgi:FMN phosphatase YigB (HAD superfamily)